MAKRALLILSILIIVAALLLAAGILYYSNFKENREAQKIKNQRMEEMRQANPQLLDKLLFSIGELEKKVKENPKDWESFRDLGVNYNGIGDYKNAEEAYKKAAELSPKNVVIWNNLAQLYVRQERYEEAKEAFLKILEFDDTNAPAYLGLAEMYSNNHAGTVDEAKYILQQGILKTGSQGLKSALEALNGEGRL
jgi:cytochrome c-type biogenesis protein CcmH/NrfG